MTELLSHLPPLPERMRELPVDPRGYPVPWFVTWQDEAGKVCPRGQGTPDFRVITIATWVQAYKEARCWICGKRRGAYGAFVIGPMCCVNRTSSEPPSHFDCADFAARACPFLVNPAQRRRENNLPEDKGTVGGFGIKRNPGVALVWSTKKWKAVRDGQGGVVVRFGDPELVRWYCEGRPATRAEVEASIDSGLPLLVEVARSQEEVKAIHEARGRAARWLPAA